MLDFQKYKSEIIGMVMGVCIIGLLAWFSVMVATQHEVLKWIIIIIWGACGIMTVWMGNPLFRKDKSINNKATD